MHQRMLPTEIPKEILIIQAQIKPKLPGVIWMELKGSYKMVSLVDLEIVRDRGKRAKSCCAGTCCKWQTSSDTEGRPLCQTLQQSMGCDPLQSP